MSPMSFYRCPRHRFCSHGWGSTYQLAKKDIQAWEDGTEAEAAVKRHTAKTWDYVEQNYEQMREMAEFCKAKGIQLVLITTPCWASYYEHLDAKQLAKTNELTEHFREEYNLPYFDYLKDSRFEADDFYDSNHLSDVGAIKFTKILDEDIRTFQASKKSNP